MPRFVPSWFGGAVLLLLVVIAFGVWLSLHGHFLASSSLSLHGGDVEWSLSDWKWLRGGETTVAVDGTMRNVTDADVQQIPQLKHVVGLSLTNCAELSDQGLAVLRRLPELRSLDLSRHPSPYQIHKNPRALTDAALAHVEGLRRLRELSLSGTSITDAGLARLKSLSELEVLDLTDTHITDAGLRHLKGLKRLRLLVLDSPDVTQAGRDELQAALPELEMSIPEAPGTPRFGRGAAKMAPGVLP
jgi:hypothetical protein